MSELWGPRVQAAQVSDKAHWVLHPEIQHSQAWPCSPHPELASTHKKVILASCSLRAELQRLCKGGHWCSRLSWLPSMWARQQPLPRALLDWELDPEEDEKGHVAAVPHHSRRPLKSPRAGNEKNVHRRAGFLSPKPIPSVLWTF